MSKRWVIRKSFKGRFHTRPSDRLKWLQFFLNPLNREVVSSLHRYPGNSQNNTSRFRLELLPVIEYTLIIIDKKKAHTYKRQV